MISLIFALYIGQVPPQIPSPIPIPTPASCPPGYESIGGECVPIPEPKPEVVANKLGGDV